MKSAIHTACVVATVAIVNSIASGDLPDLSDLAPFSIFGDSYVSLGDNANISEGRIGNNDPDPSGISAGSGLAAPQGVLGRGSLSVTGGAQLGRIVMNGDVSLSGDGSQATGGLDAGGNVFIGDNTTIQGDLTAGGFVSIGLFGSSHVTGNLDAAGGYFLSPGSSVGSAIPGGTPASVAAVTTPIHPTPGPYGSINVGNAYTLALSAGEYYYDSIDAGDDFTLALDLTGGDVSIFVKNDAKFLDGATVTTVGDGELFAYTNGSWSIGNAGDWTGIIYAPIGGVTVGDSFSITGRLYGSSVIAGDGLEISGPLPAPPIPAPSAFCLGAIGLGLVARKRTSRQA